MALLKQSTAYTRMFKLISSTDHFSAKTGATATVNLSKAGAAFGAAGGTVTEVANGWYKIALSTADTNTLGDLAYYITASGADDTDFVDQVSARITDDLAYPATSGRSMVVDAAGLVDANVVKVGPSGAGTAQTAGDIMADTNDIQTRLPAALVGGRMDSSVGAMAADVITAAATAADFGTEVAGAVWDLDATAHQTQGTFGQAIGDPVADTGTIYKAVVSDATGATVGVDVVDLKTQIGTAGAGLTAIDLPDQTMNITGNITGNLSGSVGSVTGAVGSVTANVNAVLTNGAHGGAAATAQFGGAGGITSNLTGNVTGSVGSVTGAVGSVTGAVGSVTGNVGGSVASVATGGIAAASFAAGAIDAAAIAANAIGASEIADGAIDAATFAAGAIDAAAIAANAIGASELAADAVAEIADGVWDEARSGHTAQGTYGENQAAVISASAITGTLSTTQMTTDLTNATNDSMNGRTVIFKGNVTAALAGVATNITAYVGASKLVTMTAIPSAPANGDLFEVF